MIRLFPAFKLISKSRFLPIFLYLPQDRIESLFKGFLVSHAQFRAFQQLLVRLRCHQI